MAQQVKDQALSPKQRGSLLWCRFSPWPWNFHMLQAWPQRRKKKKKKTQWHITSHLLDRLSAKSRKPTGVDEDVEKGKASGTVGGTVNWYIQRERRSISKN